MKGKHEQFPNRAQQNARVAEYRSGLDGGKETVTTDQQLEGRPDSAMIVRLTTFHGGLEVEVHGTSVEAMAQAIRRLDRHGAGAVGEQVRLPSVGQYLARPYDQVKADPVGFLREVVDAELPYADFPPYVGDAMSMVLRMVTTPVFVGMDVGTEPPQLVDVQPVHPGWDGPFKIGDCHVFASDDDPLDGSAVFGANGQPFCLIADDMALGGRPGAAARATRIAEALNACHKAK